MYIFLILNKKNQNKTSKKKQTKQNKNNNNKKKTNKQTNKTKQKNPHGFNQNLPRKQSISLSYNM